tara:strand:- start:6981 stop:8141 length:1161 start_codon:yes stop_codon:yes gene_type:complete
MATIKTKVIETPKKVKESNSLLLTLAIKGVKKIENQVKLISHSENIRNEFSNADDKIRDFLQSFINTCLSFSIRHVEGMDYKNNLSLQDNLIKEISHVGINLEWLIKNKKTHIEYQFVKTRNLSSHWALGNIVNSIMDQLTMPSKRLIIEIPYVWLKQENLQKLAIKFITIMDTVNYQITNDKTVVNPKTNKFTKNFFYLNNRGIHVPLNDNRNKANGYLGIEGFKLTKEMSKYIESVYDTNIKGNEQDINDLYLAYAPSEIDDTPSDDENANTHKTKYIWEHKEIDIEDKDKSKKSEFYDIISTHDWHVNYQIKFDMTSKNEKPLEVTNNKDQTSDTYHVVRHIFNPEQIENKPNTKELKNRNYYSVTMLKTSTFKNVATLKTAK